MDHGPSAPAESEQIGRWLLEAMASDPRIRLVDVAGHPLNGAARAAANAELLRLSEAGIKRMLELRYDSAQALFEQALAWFERRLIDGGDYARLHDVLLAQAESFFQSGHRARAKVALTRLAAQGPKVAPSPKTHPPELVALWEEAQKACRFKGRLSISVEEPGATVSVNGVSLGPAPVTTELRSCGVHYVAAHFFDRSVSTSVHVIPKDRVAVKLSRSDAGETARREILAAAELRLGLVQAGQRAQALAEAAGTAEVLIGAVRSTEGGAELVLGRHGGAGAPAVFAAIALPDLAQRLESARSAVTSVAGALLTQRDAGSIRVDAMGRQRPAKGLAAILYEPGARGALAAFDQPPGATEPPVFPVAPPAAPPPSLTERWWFWALIGGTAALGVVAGVALAAPDPTTTRVELVWGQR